MINLLEMICIHIVCISLPMKVGGARAVAALELASRRLSSSSRRLSSPSQRLSSSSRRLSSPSRRLSSSSQCLSLPLPPATALLVCFLTSFLSQYLFFFLFQIILGIYLFIYFLIGPGKIVWEINQACGQGNCRGKSRWYSI